MSVTRLQAPFPLIWRGFWEDTMHYGMHWPKRQGFRNKAHDEVHVQFLLGLPTSIRNSKLLRILTGFRANFRKSIPWRLGCAYAVGILQEQLGDYGWNNAGCLTSHLLLKLLHTYAKKHCHNIPIAPNLCINSCSHAAVRPAWTCCLFLGQLCGSSKSCNQCSTA